MKKRPQQFAEPYMMLPERTGYSYYHRNGHVTVTCGVHTSTSKLPILVEKIFQEAQKWHDRPEGGVYRKDPDAVF